MASWKPLAGLSAAALLAACGGADNEIPLTNTGQVILNDAQANYQFRNDEPPPEPDFPTGNAATGNMATGDAAMGDDAAMAGNTMGNMAP